eukprot:CAMPEP_0118697722 /NCGR_PEP_ID=MMETSP0800-20121206/14706_1 /TAXON_ID=210618 ORGANISM="Striatella unipunctata, Strain CCMP2910" /NCGR_SAMPLE_ID=MMETSP0800 /ASSEMBLY_ACC=CAM_ASM_000638 /LENGTH=505 /DNA_ID=CAMNT_0006597269 /DNA_START=173 /DNA_END=1690 /DNA_ORIENTATION=+
MTQQQQQQLSEALTQAPNMVAEGEGGAGTFPPQVQNRLVPEGNLAAGLEQANLQAPPGYVFQPMVLVPQQVVNDAKNGIGIMAQQQQQFGQLPPRQDSLNALQHGQDADEDEEEEEEEEVVVKPKKKKKKKKKVKSAPKKYAEEDEEEEEPRQAVDIPQPGQLSPEELKQQEAIPLKELKRFKDSWGEYSPSDVPVFWHIPKAGGSTIKDILGGCHRFVMASEFGVTDGHHKDKKIAVVYPAGGNPGQDRSPFVNVDTTTVDGIARAKALGFADSGLADFVVTPFIYEANDLFTKTANGRLFTVFRHPVERAISMFYYIQVADWEPTYKPELKSWTLEQYATSDIIENNWMTRQLSNQLGGDLTEDNLKVALEVIRRKFLVGLMSEMETTMGRFEKFFRWKYHVNPTNQEKCRVQLLSGGANSNSKNKPKKEKPKPGDKVYELLAWQNNYDLQLYEYIEALFQEQEAFVNGLPDDFRLMDATCCKCSPPTFPPEGFECPVPVVNT